MNRVNALIVVLFLSVFLTPPSVIAQTNQGLEWGFTPSDEYYFMMHVDADGMLIDEEIFFNSTDTLPVIPDSLDNWTDIPYVVMDAYYANGTDLGPLVLIFLAAHNIQLPIGNWSLMSSIYSSTLEVDHFELDPLDPYFWGYSWDDDNWEYGWVHAAEGLTLFVHVDYFKEDGYLSHYFVESYNTTTEEKTGELELNRIGMEPYRDKTAPVLNHPDDVGYFEGGSSGESITWTPSDEFPLSYEVWVDGTTLMSGDWNSSSESITVPVWGLEAGEYNYTVEVSDFAGNTASDTVIVSVQAPDIFAGLWPYILIAGAGILIIIVVVAYRKLSSR
ncbi:MAG: Ig domain-containing protein [Candidatus Thorarchaeota archaeon]